MFKVKLSVSVRSFVHVVLSCEVCVYGSRSFEHEQLFTVLEMHH